MKVYIIYYILHTVLVHGISRVYYSYTTYHMYFILWKAVNTKVFTMSQILLSIFYFILAGIAEIGGGYLVWLYLKDDKSPWYMLAGAITLIIYGIIPTLQEAPFGKVYAAYGGIFIALSILWGYYVDGITPDRYDIIGGIVSIIGVLIIMYYPR